MSTHSGSMDAGRFAHGTWTREPVSTGIDETGALVVEAAEGSDWWRDTAYGFRHENGHALLHADRDFDAMEKHLGLKTL